MQRLRLSVGVADPRLKKATAEVKSANALVDKAARKLAQEYRIKLGASSELMLVLRPNGIPIFEFPEPNYRYGQGQYVISYSVRVVYSCPPENPGPHFYLA